ncbi:MAG: hypothetical protein HC770_00135 [Pseudanabaena sp. CRU_2_10]|nr:hypothetical protein [Pseudanabaena sp. CRU_2_10]
MNEITKTEIRKRLGNITQLQELLFGDQIDEYNSKLEQYNQRLDTLEANLQKSQKTIEVSIAQAEKKLFEHIFSVASALEKNSHTQISKTQEQQRKLQQQLDKVVKYSQEHLDFLHQSLNTKTNSLKSEITQTKSALDQDLNLVKQDLLAKLENNLAELTTDKISRTDLAEVFFELSLKLKRTDADLNLADSKDLKTFTEDSQANLMLPETKQT